MIWDDRKGRPYAKGKVKARTFVRAFFVCTCVIPANAACQKEVSRVSRSIIQEYSPGIGSPNLFCCVYIIP